VRFAPGWGAPAQATFDKLISWTDHADKGVRYFSGTAAYDKEINISADQLGAGRELWLDLGVVKNFAEVSLNGHDLGVLWKPPFRVNATAAAKPAGSSPELLMRYPEVRDSIVFLWKLLLTARLFSATIDA